jgi:hypothetical protein
MTESENQGSFCSFHLIDFNRNMLLVPGNHRRVTGFKTCNNQLGARNESTGTRAYGMGFQRLLKSPNLIYRNSMDFVLKGPSMGVAMLHTSAWTHHE